MMSEPMIPVQTPAVSGFSDSPEVMKSKPRSRMVGQAPIRMSASKTTRMSSEDSSITSSMTLKITAPGSVRLPSSVARTASRVARWVALVRSAISRSPEIGARGGCSPS